MKEKFHKNILEMISILITIFSVTYIVNSILVNGFDVSPISLVFGTAIGLLIVFFKNLLKDEESENMLKIINIEEGENLYREYGSFLLYLITLDLFFYILNLL